MVMSGGIYVPPMSIGTEPPSFNRRRTDASLLNVVNREATDSGFQTQPSLASLGLTPRQTDVLALLLKGNPNKLIARELGLSVETVKDHVAAVLRALGVSSRTQAVLAVSQMTQQHGNFSAWRSGSR
jgi:DNA-binding NarL/FixJ family response regulator